MKKTILLMMMFIIIPLALSISGGETWLYHFDECDELRVDITGILEIDEGEYTIHNECEGENNSFVCDCFNNFDFNVSFETNTVNNYTFAFNYDYSREIVETTTSSGGGGGGGAFSKHLRSGTSFKAVLVSGLNSYFYFDGDKHTMRLTSYSDDHINLLITSEPIEVGLFLNETKVIEFENESLEIYFQKIYGKTVTLILTRLEKEPIADIPDTTPISPDAAIPISEPQEVEPTPQTIDDIEEVVDEELEPEKSKTWIYIILGIVFVSLVIAFILVIKK